MHESQPGLEYELGIRQEIYRASKELCSLRYINAENSIDDKALADNSEFVVPFPTMGLLVEKAIGQPASKLAIFYEDEVGVSVNRGSGEAFFTTMHVTPRRDTSLFMDFTLSIQNPGDMQMYCALYRGESEESISLKKRNNWIPDISDLENVVTVLNTIRAKDARLFNGSYNRYIKGPLGGVIFQN